MALDTAAAVSRGSAALSRRAPTTDLQWLPAADSVVTGRELGKQTILGLHLDSTLRNHPTQEESVRPLLGPADLPPVNY